MAATLVVNADDLGMCASVNAGVIDAFRGGIVTQASIMAPAPAFRDGAALAVRHGVPTAVHLTLASEWDQVRWAPMTDGAGLRGPDGALPLHPRQLLGAVDRAVLLAEMLAQVEAVRGAGLEPIHLDHHVAALDDTAVSVCKRYSLRCRDYLNGHAGCCLGFQSVFSLSPIPAADKATALIEYISSLRSEGAHLVICHPARAGADLDALCSTAFRERRLWAYDHRISDLAALLSPRVMQAVSRAGIRLATSAAVPSVSEFSA